VHEQSYRNRSVRLSPERIASETNNGWPNKIILDYFDENRERMPNKTAVVSLLADAGITKRVSFAELGDAADRIALRLFRLGVRSGDVVSFQLNNRWEFFALSLACVRLGALQNPLMPVLRERELRFMLGLAESKVFVVPRTFRQFDHASLAVSISAFTLISAGVSPSTSATTWASTVRWPWPCGTEATCTDTLPTGSIAIVAVACAPFFGPALRRSAAVSTVVM